jgi:hypothetical protein
LAARIFLDHLVAAVPYQIHTVLTDNAIQFADRPRTERGRRPDGAATPSTALASSTA